MRLRRLLVVPVALSLFVVGCEPPPVEGKAVGNISPDVIGVDVDGKTIKLSDYKGKVVLLSFWGTWCPPCRAQLPHEMEMVSKNYAGRPFAILGVANDSPETLKAFLKRNPLPWANIVDGQTPGIITDQWGITAFPSAYVIDHQGIIRGVWRGGMDKDDVWELVKKLVAAAE